MRSCSSGLRQVVGPVGRAEAAPGDEVRAGRDRRGRVDLEHRQLPDDRDQVGRPRRVEQLRAHGDPPGLALWSAGAPTAGYFRGRLRISSTPRATAAPASATLAATTRSRPKLADRIDDVAAVEPVLERRPAHDEGGAEHADHAGPRPARHRADPARARDAATIRTSQPLFGPCVPLRLDRPVTRPRHEDADRRGGDRDHGDEPCHGARTHARVASSGSEPATLARSAAPARPQGARRSSRCVAAALFVVVYRQVLGITQRPSWPPPPDAVTLGGRAGRDGGVRGTRRRRARTTRRSTSRGRPRRRSSPGSRA